MPILYDVPAGMVATIDGPATVRVRASSPESRYQMHDTGAPPAAPMIDYLAPTEAELPSATVDVGGTGFSSRSVCVLDGVEAITGFVGAEMLRATVSAPAAGSYELLVRDGLNDSNIVMFTFTDPAGG